MTTTLERELLQAAELAEAAGHKTGTLGSITEGNHFGRQLRQRAAWVRELMAGPRGALSIAQQLAGPIPSETAPAAPKGDPVLCGFQMVFMGKPQAPSHRCVGFRKEVTGETSDDPEACDAESESNRRCPPGVCVLDPAPAAPKEGTVKL